jgi:hemolysin activation/secretion protein
MEPALKLKVIHSRIKPVSTLLALSCFASSAMAQQATTLQNNEQRLNRHYEQQERVREPEAPADPLAQPAPPAAQSNVLPAGQHFHLNAVKFTPSALLPAAAFENAAAPFVGKEIDGEGVAKLLEAVNAVYTEKNITTARAIVGPQAIQDGVLQVELVEGRLGELSIEGEKYTREAFIKDRVQMKTGEVVDTEALRKQLVYLNKTTQLQVRAMLQPGAERGETDVRLNVVEPERWGADFFVDNNGADSTGKVRVGVQGFMYGIFGRDDRFTGSLAHAQGGNDGAFSYSAPVLPGNGRLSVNASHSQINIINGPFAAIDVVGTSTVYGVEYDQPLLANSKWLVTGTLAYSRGNATTDISGVSIADTNTDLITAGVSTQYVGDGRQWGITQLYTRIKSDEPMLGETSFQTYPGNAFYIQRLGQSRWVFRGNLGWQFSKGDNLPSANLFQVGGLGSVRGYERGIVSGARGYYASLELHRLMSERLDVYGFADHGVIEGFYPQAVSITGAGIGTLWRPKTWLSVSADVASPFNKIVPKQEGFRANLRITFHWR